MPSRPVSESLIRCALKLPIVASGCWSVLRSLRTARSAGRHRAACLSPSPWRPAGEGGEITHLKWMPLGLRRLWTGTRDADVPAQTSPLPPTRPSHPICGLGLESGDEEQRKRLNRLLRIRRRLPRNLPEPNPRKETMNPSTDGARVESGNQKEAAGLNRPGKINQKHLNKEKIKKILREAPKDNPLSRVCLITSVTLK